MTGVLLFGAFLFVFWSGYLARGAVDRLRHNVQSQRRDVQELSDALARLESTGGLPEPDPDQF